MTATRSRVDLSSVATLTPVLAPAKLVQALGGFFAMSLDTLVALFRPPFAWREYILQSWFVARVSIVPSLALVLPWSVLIIFTLNTLLMDIGAADFSGRPLRSPW